MTFSTFRSGKSCISRFEHAVDLMHMNKEKMLLV
ncbi:hypothetical protein T09_10047 [Trichinella sp. T9]|nr:hypothetical protein T09_10047 [Trichinella sp. T9]